MKIKHYDLFAGIGGFSLALDQVFYDCERKHIFCEWEPFPTAILKKHWMDGTFYGDIRDLVADTKRKGREGELRDTEGQHRLRDRSGQDENITILTGGFPCQPFSHAGRRQGTADDRYLWREMLAVIQNTKPDWVIAENVRGLVTWNEGMVLETVCADLEAEGYEVQPFLIPAVAVGAPHRRERVWIVANNIGKRPYNEEDEQELERARSNELCFEQSRDFRETTPNPRQQLREQGGGDRMETDTTERATRSIPDKRSSFQDWERDWREVALATCNDRVDDGLPRQMDGVTISGARHRKERLKACGNAIVPQVAMEIFKAIRESVS